MEHIKPQNTGQFTPEEQHEDSDVNVKGVLGFLVFLGIMALLIHVAVWGMYIGLGKWEDSHDPQPNPMVAQAKNATAPGGTVLTQQSTADVQKGMQRLVSTFPEPRLQPDDTRDMDVFRRSEEKILHSYSRVDASGETVRIPVERAMELIAQRGLPDFGSAAGAKGSIGQTMAQPGQNSGRLPVAADKSTKK
jgi:hypothetical protein